MSTVQAQMPSDNQNGLSRVSSSVEGPISGLSADKRINVFMGHAYAMLDGLSEQYRGHLGEQSSLSRQIATVYNKAREALKELEKEIKQQMNLKALGSSNLNKKDIKQLKKLLDSAEKKVAGIVRQAQVETAAVIGAHAVVSEDLETRGSLGHVTIADQRMVETVDKMVKGGIRQFIVQVKAKLTKSDSLSNRALRVLAAGREFMESASRREIDGVGNARIDQEKVVLHKKLVKGERSEELQRRANVIGVRVGAKSIYRIGLTFDPDKTHQQFRSVRAQDLSSQTRTTINKEVTIYGLKGKESALVTSRLVPLNREFDASLAAGNRRLQTGTFGTIFGDRGISSMDRAGHHLVNAYDSTLVIPGGRVVYETFRHGNVSVGKKVKSVSVEERQATAQQSTQDLLKAVLLKQIRDSGQSVAELAESSKVRPVVLRFNSLSLLTPVIGYHERALVMDQIEALRSYQGSGKFLEIDGQLIQIDLRCNLFNFGVNRGATGTFALGSTYQFQLNTQALIGTQDTRSDSLLGQYQEAIGLLDDPSLILSDKEKLRANMQNLKDDIVAFMQDDTTYLKGKIPYEISAKIIALNNCMNTIFKAAGRPGVYCAFNCMSDKDRSGMLDCVGKTLAAMYIANGRYPTRAELDTKNLKYLDEQIEEVEKELAAFKRQGDDFSIEYSNKIDRHQELVAKRDRFRDIQRQFATILQEMLLGSGGLELLETNTGARGYKLGPEANFEVFQELGEDFSFLNIVGLSKTTES